jgi:hypothetical protein
VDSSSLAYTFTEAVCHFAPTLVRGKHAQQEKFSSHLPWLEVNMFNKKSLVHIYLVFDGEKLAAGG